MDLRKLKLNNNSSYQHLQACFNLVVEINKILPRISFNSFSRLHPISASTFYRWLAIWIEMGASKKKSIYKYWNKQKGNNQIQEIMSRNNGNLIYRALWHLPVDYLKALEQKLNEEFLLHWNPYEFITINECMRLFKGWTRNKVYCPAKPVKQGLKFYLWVDNKHFCFHTEMYWNDPEKKKKEKEKGSIMKNLVLNIVKKLPESMGPYCIYADNWYGSLTLAEELHQLGHYFTIECRAKRPFFLFQDGLIGI